MTPTINLPEQEQLISIRLIQEIQKDVAIAGSSLSRTIELLEELCTVDANPLVPFVNDYNLLANTANGMDECVINNNDDFLNLCKLRVSFANLLNPMNTFEQQVKERVKKIKSLSAQAIAKEMDNFWDYCYEMATFLDIPDSQFLETSIVVKFNRIFKQSRITKQKFDEFTFEEFQKEKLGTKKKYPKPSFFGSSDDEDNLLDSLDKFSETLRKDPENSEFQALLSDSKQPTQFYTRLGSIHELLRDNLSFLPKI